MSFDIMKGLGSVIGPAVTGIFQGSQNRRSRQWAEKQSWIEHQRNIQLWNMQNEYNHPAAAFERMKGSGFNPNSLFGSGGSGIAGTAGSVTAPRTPDAQFRSPDFTNFNPAAQYQDTRQKEAQVSLLDEQKKAVIANTALTAAKTLTEKEENVIRSNIAKYSGDAFRLAVEKTKADIDYTVHEDMRKAAMNTSNLQEATERILTAKLGRDYTRYLMKESNLRSDLIKLDKVMKQLDIDLWKDGITRNDPLPFRMLYEKIKEYIPSRKEEVDNWLKPFKNKLQPKSGGKGW